VVLRYRHQVTNPWHWQRQRSESNKGSDQRANMGDKKICTLILSANNRQAGHAGMGAACQCHKVKHTDGKRVHLYMPQIQAPWNLEVPSVTQWHSASVTVGAQKIRIQFTLPLQQPTIKASGGENRNLFFITMVAKRWRKKKVYSHLFLSIRAFSRSSIFDRLSVPHRVSRRWLQLDNSIKIIEVVRQAC
jgi:hypothetical protein